jgi:transposase
MNQERVSMSAKERDRIAVVQRCCAGTLSASRGAALLDLSVRQIFVLKAKYRQGGEMALLHGLRGRTPPNAVPAADKERILAWCRGDLAGCNFSHMADLLAEERGVAVSAETLRRWLRAEGLGPAPRKLQAHRRRRQRKPRAGEMLFLDGSPHPWFGPQHPPCCLLLASDDATGDPLWGCFVPHENLAGVWRVCFEVFRRCGLPASFYVDRASWAKVTKHRPDGAAECRPDLTNWQLALRELGVAVIHAHSPQARGRGERLNGSFQGRLVAEFVRQDIHDLAAATQFLNQRFIPRWRKRFHRVPANPEPAWRPAPDDAALGRILSVRVRRTVGNDNCVTYLGRTLQLLPTTTHRHFVKAQVEIRETCDGRLLVIHPRVGELPFALAPVAPLTPHRSGAILDATAGG